MSSRSLPSFTHLEVQETGEWESTFWKMLEESKCDDWSFQGHTIWEMKLRKVEAIWCPKVRWFRWWFSWVPFSTMIFCFQRFIPQIGNFESKDRSIISIQTWQRPYVTHSARVHCIAVTFTLVEEPMSRKSSVVRWMPEVLKWQKGDSQGGRKEGLKPWETNER